MKPLPNPPKAASDASAPERCAYGQTKPGTDWLAWSLQFVFGFFIGAGVGFIMARRLVGFRFIGFGQMLYVMGGAALCCGACTSFLGNRALMMPSLYGPTEPTPSRRARTCSFAVGIAGASLVFLSILAHIIDAGWPIRKSTSLEFGVFLLLLAALPGFLLVHALRTGTGFWRFGGVDRAETPLFFWIYVFLNALALFCMLSAVLC
jgi:hypothetical protein